MSKLSRNDLCWCGSGKKYKKCHMDLDEKLEILKDEGYEIPPRTLIKTPEQIEGIRESAKITVGALDLVGEKIKAGMTTEEIDKLVYDYTVEKGGIPAPLNYMGYPKSVCTSINDEVCHGIPSKDVVLKEGDIVNVDISTILKGYFSDASRMYVIGKASDEAVKLVEVTKKAMEKGIETVKPFVTLGDMAHEVQKVAEDNGYSVVRDFGGHGVGIEFHEDPFVPHVGEKGTGMVLAPGMVFTIEPMVNVGGYELEVLENDWTAVTTDGSLSAQWEHTILVTEDGFEILTK